jgi:hypothetical protein
VPPAPPPIWQPLLSFTSPVPPPTPVVPLDEAPLPEAQAALQLPRQVWKS